MERERTRPLIKVKFRDVNVTDKMEINNDLEVLMNESHMEIATKHTNKDYTFDSSFLRLERVNKEEFYDEYKDMELGRVIYYANYYYKISSEDITRLQLRYERRYRRMDIEKLKEIFKIAVIKECSKNIIHL